VTEFLQTQRDVYERLLCFLPLDLDDFQQRLRVQGGVKILKPKLKALLSAQGASFMSKAAAKSFQLSNAAAASAVANIAAADSTHNKSGSSSSSSSCNIEETHAVDTGGQSEVFEVDSDSSSGDHGNEEHFDDGDYCDGNDRDDCGIEHHVEYYDDDDEDYFQRINEDYHDASEEDGGSFGDNVNRGEEDEAAGGIVRAVDNEEEEEAVGVEGEEDANDEDNNDDTQEDSSSFIDLTSPSYQNTTLEQQSEEGRQPPSSLLTSPIPITMTSPVAMMTSPFESPLPPEPRPTPLSSSSPDVVEVGDGVCFSLIRVLLCKAQANHKNCTLH